MNGISTNAMVEAWLAVSHSVYGNLQKTTNGIAPKELMLGVLEDSLDTKQDSELIDLNERGAEESLDEIYRKTQEKIFKKDSKAKEAYEAMDEAERALADAITKIIFKACKEGKGNE